MKSYLDFTYKFQASATEERVRLEVLGAFFCNFGGNETRGLEAMLEAIRPSNILCYGPMLAEVGIETTEHPTYWNHKEEY